MGILLGTTAGHLYLYFPNPVIGEEGERDMVKEERAKSGAGIEG